MLKATYKIVHDLEIVSFQPSPNSVSFPRDKGSPCSRDARPEGPRRLPHRNSPIKSKNRTRTSVARAQQISTRHRRRA